MSAETVFIVLGLTLTGMALIVSLIGLRMESFPPSRGVLLGGIGAFVAVVVGAMVFAWQGASDEQEHRDEERAAGELPTPAETMAELQDEADQAIVEASGEAPPAGEPGEEPEAGGGAAAGVDVVAVFDEQGCAGCHTLKAAGSTGTIGPDLDATLEGADVAYIEESIVDPEAELAKGFSGGIMPQDFEQKLTPEELEALVAFLAESVGAQG
jgi:mono/diheme cytochrome c family protein